MKRVYKFPKEFVCSGEPRGLLTNGYGGYYCVDASLSYQGWYLLSPKDWHMQKILESLTPLNEGDCTEFVHQLYGLHRKFSSGAQDVAMMYQKVLLYQAINFHDKLRFTFDHRESYTQNELGRVYDVDVQDDDFILLTFRKYDGDNVIQEKFVGIKGVHDVSIINNWRQKSYSFDASRGAASDIWVYDAFDAIPKNNVVISSADSAYEARTLCDIAYFHFDDIVCNLQVQSSRQLVEYSLGDERLNAAASLASHSLQSLHQKFFFDHRHITGVYAGLPWFFQLWSRDELISLGGLIQLSANRDLQLETHHSLSHIKAILSRHVKSVLANGMLANRFPHSELGSIDSIGWLAKRVNDFLSLLKEKQQLYTLFSIDDLVLWFNQFEKALNYGKRDHFSNGLFSNKFCETWMDTAVNDDGRVGYRVEIQALYYALYDVLVTLGKLTGSSKVKDYELEQEVFKKTVNQYFVKEVIVDGLNLHLEVDAAFRPNLFLASYVAPDLFSKKDLEKSFDMYLEKLFVDWGGLTTINKDHHLFQPNYTGEQNASYHRGDVWYFVNHLAALSLLQLNKNKYGDYVAKIVSATCTDILELGLAGHCSEISSASEQRAQACLAQAWSVATFVELVSELQKN